MVTIYTDGSVSEDLQSSGSAAVVTVGPPEDCRRVTVRRSSFRGATSSFEAELRALVLAVEWVASAEAAGRGRELGVENVVGPSVLICSDSRSVLASLKVVQLDQRPSVWRLRDMLSALNERICLQWVPAHCGLRGNEMADEEANVARVMQDDVGNVGSEFVSSVSLTAVKAMVRRLVLDPPPEHPRVAAVYRRDSQVDWGGGFFPSSPRLDRAEAVLLAQLRSGHCLRLSAYSALITRSGTGICSLCMQEQQTLEHWLQACPAMCAQRLSFLGDPNPPLSVLLQAPRAVLALARATLPRR